MKAEHEYLRMQITDCRRFLLRCVFLMRAALIVNRVTTNREHNLQEVLTGVSKAAAMGAELVTQTRFDTDRTSYTITHEWSISDEESRRGRCAARFRTLPRCARGRLAFTYP